MTYEVTNRRVPSPTAPGLMLDRGYVLVLQPELYQRHAELAARLDRIGGWRAVPAGSEPIVTEAPERAPAEESAILPHQAEVLARLRQSQKE